MNRRFATALVVGITSLGVIGPVVPAHADTPGCVNRSEYRKVKNGFKIARVHRIFDTTGSQSFHMSGYQSREYRTCGSQYGFVMVDYERRQGAWKVTSKAAYWG